MSEILVEDAARQGIEVITFRGGPGYEDEQISVSNSVGNGLRVSILNEAVDPAWFSFNIDSPATAEAIARRLLEWASRIANPR